MADKSIKGTIVVGTPAEEAGGGKIQLINRGAFKDISAAMMVHPSKYTSSDPPVLSRYILTVEFKGKETHASAFPWEGLNALDAAVSLYQSLGLLRQQMKPSCRIHAIITKGGSAPNVIPAETALKIHLRAPTKKELKVLRTKIENCVMGAALSTGCAYTAVFDEDNLYDDLLTNKTMRELFDAFAKKLGVLPTDISTLETIPVGSSDMGNVSYIVPSIHPFYGINTEALNHTKDFTTAAGLAEAQQPTLATAKAMAMTALTLMSDPAKLALAKAQYDQQAG